MPCCFPTCRSITYLLVDGDTVVPVPRLIDIEEHLDYVTNRVMPDLEIRHALEKLWSASAVPASATTAAAARVRHAAASTCPTRCGR